jgi:glycosyltransferase involved in cell wall biosynthesis
VATNRKGSVMKKIVIDARESGTTTGRYIDKLIEYLHKLRPAHDIVVLTKPHRVEFMKSVAPTFTVVESPFKEFTFSEQLGFWKQIRSLKADLVHFTMVQQPILYRGRVVTTMQDLTAARFKNPSKNPFVFTAKQTIYKFVNWYVAHKSAHIITPSKFVKRDIMKFAHVPARKFTVTYESADKIPDKPEPVDAVKGKPFIMYVGRPQPHKNLERLIEAFEGLQYQNPSLHLVLAGKMDATYRIIETKVRQKNIPNVVFTDFVTEGQLRWLYEHCRAYAFPSLSEGFGLPGLEAMRHGAPVASSNATCLPEIYGKAAQYFDPTKVSDIVRAIQEILDDDKLRQQLVHDGKLRAEHYSWQHMANQTLHVYESVLGK